MVEPRLTPSTFRDAQGIERLAARTFWFERAPEVTCPAGHRLHVSTHSLVEFSTKCRYSDARDRQQTCGRCIYVVTDWNGGDGGSLNLIVEVTSDEILVMRRLTMSQKLQFLGLKRGGSHAVQAG